jgi:hypothetical protein
LVQLSEDGIRKLADERMKEWSKDQEEYTERQFRDIEEQKQALKSQAKEAEIEKAETERQTKFLQEVEAEMIRRSHLPTEERDREFQKIARTPVDVELEMDERFVKATVDCEEILQGTAERRRLEEEAERERVKQLEIWKAQEEERRIQEEERRAREEERRQKEAEQKLMEERRREANRLAEENRKQERMEREKAEQERKRIADELESKAREERRAKMLEDERARRLEAKEEAERRAEERRKQEAKRRRPITIELDFRGQISRWKSTADRFYNEKEIFEGVKRWADLPRWMQLYPTEMHEPEKDYYSWRCGW